MALEDSLAFTGFSSIIRKNTKAKNAVRAYIDSILGIKDIEVSFMDAAIFMIKELSANSIIRHDLEFWHIQSIINKTVKYMYIMSYGNPEVRKKFENAHCPLEVTLVHNAIEDLKSIERSATEVEVQAEAKRYLSEFNVRLLKQPVTKNTFSDTTQYKLFQEIIEFISKQKGIYPIEYSYLV